MLLAYGVVVQQRLRCEMCRNLAMERDKGTVQRRVFAHFGDPHDLQEKIADDRPPRAAHCFDVLA